MKPGEGHNVKTAGTFEIESLDERKTMLMDHIANVPGIRYRELRSQDFLTAFFLSFDRIGRSRSYSGRKKTCKKTTRYYPINISEVESAILSCLRHQPLREIILFILDNHQGTLSDIANYTGKSISTVSSHLGKPKTGRNNFYQEKRTGLLFSLANPELAANVALKDS